MVVLGVDGGGTATHAMVADERGDVRGFAIGRASNWENVGIRSAIESIRTASRSALAEAATSAQDVDGAVYGLAGVDFSADEQEMSAAHFSLELGCPFQVLNDSFVALRAGTNDPWGVVVVSGTGSVVAGRNPAGEVFRTLGLGPIYGDDGSASEVSFEAITAVAAQVLGTGPRTDGKLDGFRLASVMPLGFFDKIGLQTNDLLQRINGVEIRDPGILLSLFQQLRNERTVRVDIVRNTQRQILTYEIR